MATPGLGILIVLVLLGRVLLQPGLGIGAPNELVDIEPWAWLGVVLAACIPAGAWLALADERTDAPESRYEPPPPRPVPGGSAS
ncbi:MAG: hypothetical protein HZB46_19105 [Solirubrobacterales bacterium]|nr:hypothetical protein [Solirubrobacterales bacterium]